MISMLEWNERHENKHNGCKGRPSRVDWTAMTAAAAEAGEAFFCSASQACSPRRRSLVHVHVFIRNAAWEKEGRAGGIGGMNGGYSAG